MKESMRLKKIMMTLCLIILLIFTGTIVVRLFVRQVIVVHYGIINDFTSHIFFDNEALNRPPDYVATVYGETDDYSIDWAEEYPFAEDEEIVSAKEEPKPNGFIGKYLAVVSAVKSRIERYTQDNLAGYTFLTELGKKYEDIVGWNFASFNEYNGVFELADGSWTSLKEKKDMSEHIASTIDLKIYCDENDIDFLYVQAPYKISKYDDLDVSGVVDFSNQNADDLLAGLDNENINFLDLRTVIHDEGWTQHELFYRTDHHWKSSTGLWAAEQIVDTLNTGFGFQIDTKLFDIKNYNSVDYPEWFLGSYGKKVTLAQAVPDDFSLLYPDFDTELHYVIPSIGIDEVGDFSVTYNMEQVEGIDYYNKSPYSAYNYGDRAVIQIENLKEADLKKVLMVHDSFSDCVIPFLALGIKNIDSIDLRYFTGSLESYIHQSQPDIVIVMYNAGELVNDIDLSTHTCTFDFR